MPDTNNAAQIRGDIQRGVTGDKRPGFDPAAAPLETDSEAGGAPLSAEQTEMALRQKRRDAAPGPESYGNAMRRQPPGRANASPLIYWAGAGLLVASALAAVVVMGNA